MSSRPWYKRYPADFIAGTIHLTAEEKGVYSTLLDLLYLKHAPIEDDGKELARICDAPRAGLTSSNRRSLKPEKSSSATAKFRTPGLNDKALLKDKRPISSNRMDEPAEKNPPRIVLAPKQSMTILNHLLWLPTPPIKIYLQFIAPKNQR